MDEEMTLVDNLQQAQADAIFQQHQQLLDGCENPDKVVKNINEGIRNMNTMASIMSEDEKEDTKQQQIEKELDLKEKELEFKKEQAEKELNFKKEQSEEEMNFKKEQAEEEKKNKKWDIILKLAIAIIPIIISSIFTVIVVKITCSENRKTLLTTMVLNEIMERAGEISNVNAKDICKEALKQATTQAKFK